MSWLFGSDDITFCANECDKMDCRRNRKHLKAGIYSFSLFEGTEYCPKTKEENKNE